MLGGTFDPIHKGHIALGTLFARLLSLDKVLIMPTGTSPHKVGFGTPQEMRYEMCCLAAQEAGELFEVSRYELDREGKSYSFYTVSALLEMYPDSELFLITGADMFMTLEKWHRGPELLRLCTFCSTPRADISFEQLVEHSHVLESFGAKCFITQDMPMTVSSTQIREMVKDSQPVDSLVCKGVEEYIREHGLYR